MIRMKKPIERIEFAGPAPLSTILITDWKFWLPGAIVSFFLASVLMSGWPAGLLPDLSYPYIYAKDGPGDGLSHSWLIQRVMEGWFFDNPRSGYPFGSNFLDYPGADTGNHLVLKFLGWLTGGYHSALNLYFLLSFFISFISSFIVLRAIGLNHWFSLAATTLFVFLPFHFQRLSYLGHLYYTWYFTVPIFFYVAFRLFYWQPGREINIRRPRSLLLWLIIFLALASFGVYYTLFGMIVLALGGFAGWIRNKNISSAKWALVAIAALSFGTLLNLAPNVIHQYKAGSNTVAAARHASEAEIYAVRMLQLVLPRHEHRIKTFAAAKQKYIDYQPMKDSTAALGIIGATGFLLMWIFALRTMAEGKIESRLRLLTLLGVFLFLFGVTSGFGSLFSFFISASIRAWNRVSIFIGFASITIAFLALQLLIEKYYATQKTKPLILFLALSTILLGLFDQTTPTDHAQNQQTKQKYETDRDFIQQIEHQLPTGSAIYQLPYMEFPEAPTLNRLQSYDPLAGFLHSKSLRWNSGGMKGREGDFFYRLLAQEPIEKQIEVIKRLGFAGVYVDRRGYADNAEKLIDDLTRLLGPPSVTKADNEAVFFPLKPAPHVNLDGLTNEQIVERSGYDINLRLGKVYKADLTDGIDFSRKSWPSFLHSVTGLSVHESWGRWTDAKLAPQTQLNFTTPLPEKFTLVLQGEAFGPNVNKQLKIQIGARSYPVDMPAGIFEIRLPIDLQGEKVNTITLIPPCPTSPRSLGMNQSDTRQLGVRLIHMRFEE
jgi:phosphoglycerol transferase